MRTVVSVTALFRPCHDEVVAVRTTVDIPQPLHDTLRHRAAQSGTSIQSLIIRAIEQTYSENSKGAYVTGPLVAGKGKLGPAFPKDEIRMTAFFSDLNEWLALSFAEQTNSLKT
jgi:hypothetical protein